MDIPKHKCICQTCGSEWQNPKYEKDPLPRCGYCHRFIKWDWRKECFAVKVSEIGGWKHGNSDNLSEGDATVNYCLCGKVLNIVSPYFGNEDLHAPDSVDWALPENSYDEG